MMDGGWWHYIRYDEKAKPQISGNVLRRVAAYGRPYAGRIALMFATIVAISLLAVIPPLLIRDLIDNALPNRDFGRLNLLALGMIGVPLLSGLVGVAQRYLSSQIGEGIIFDLRRALFEHMQRMSLRFFTQSRTGELISRLNNDVVGSQQAITGTMVNIASNTIALISVLVIMLTLEWRLTLIAIAVLPLFVLPARRIGKILRRITREQMALNAEMNSLMNETLGVSGALLVKLFGRAPDEVGRFGDRARRVRDAGIRQALVGRWFFLGIGLVSAIGSAIVFWFGGYLVLQGAFTIGTIVAFSAYLTQLYGPLAALTNARVEFATALVSFERVFEVLDLPVEIDDPVHPVRLDSVQGAVEFNDVWFSYTSRNRTIAELPEVVRFRRGFGNMLPVTLGANGQSQKEVDPSAEPAWALQDVNFSAKPGELIALVGPSGAGKTTITYLLPRLYDPDRGQITLDGHDLRDLPLSTLAESIGMVTQESYLFHDTIRSNLLYAKPDATEAEIIDACRAANIHDFVMSLPDGYDTMVGERGYRLSGGEKQRLAIARVLLKNPCILILDEATSHLDSRSEALIQTALERAMQGRTSLVIAHRLSTILKADRILVLDGGRLVEEGTHAELLGRGGLYATLYETQFRPDSAANGVAGRAEHALRDSPTPV